MNDYLLIHKKVLPDYLEKVIKVREMLNNKCSISDACKTLNLPRSTYYKYKDFVYRPSVNYGNKVIISLKVVDQKGALSHLLNFIASNKGNIITINQEMPIHNIAFVTLTIDTSEMIISVLELVDQLREIDEIVDVLLIAVE